MSNQTTLIAGSSSGIKVFVSPRLLPIFKQLKKLAESGQHWALASYKELLSLTSGNVKRNVFVPSKQTGANTGTFVMLMPGSKATAIKRDDGSYLIYHFEINANYGQSASGAKKPGLHEVTKTGEGFRTKFKDSGVIKPQSGRIVTVSDGSHRNPDRAAIICADHASGAPIGGGGFNVDKDGFDLFYHRSEDRVGGVKNIIKAQDPRNDLRIRDSALLLAQSMEKSINTPDVCWITERGGAAIITQALHMLKERNVSFAKSKHHIFFSHITTNLNEAESIARSLGLQFARRTHSVNKLNFNELAGGLNVGGDVLCAYKRLRSDKDYSAVKFGVDVARSMNMNYKSASTIGACAAATTAALGMGGTAIALPAVIGTASMMAGLGSSLLKAWLPDQYNSWTRRL